MDVALWWDGMEWVWTVSGWGDVYGANNFFLWDHFDWQAVLLRAQNLTFLSFKTSLQSSFVEFASQPIPVSEKFLHFKGGRNALADMFIKVPDEDKMCPGGQNSFLVSKLCFTLLQYEHVYDPST